jgi:hypothetical protein
MHFNPLNLVDQVKTVALSAAKELALLAHDRPARI